MHMLEAPAVSGSRCLDRNVAEKINTIQSMSTQRWPALSR